MNLAKKIVDINFLILESNISSESYIKLSSFSQETSSNVN